MNKNQDHTIPPSTTSTYHTPPRQSPVLCRCGAHMTPTQDLQICDPYHKGIGERRFTAWVCPSTECHATYSEQIWWTYKPGAFEPDLILQRAERPKD